ncbi:helix-turn-helix transcriptional regulator [Cryptosporangium sp. NPDC048952]|uniref:helix-turn-helix transcriptional regulator n=1 Tax=Cryptosporangium sp. NPDC048952 TaxID=3363961 RepID=UPI00371D1280
MNPREEIAAFLRTRRARLKPSDVGLPDGIRRRTPGLRRQEVAQVAGMSIDYYIRLEQGRGPNPSRQVLSALARALLLTRDERDYLFRVAGESPPAIPGPRRELTPAIRVMLDSMRDVPAYVVDASYTVLAWNHLATHFLSDLSLVPEDDRNMIRWVFRRPYDDPYWDDEAALAFNRAMVADLRATHAEDRSVERLVTGLLGTSKRFAELWAVHDVEERRRVVKSVESPELGPLEFECQVLHIPETGQRMIVYCAEPGSPTAEIFARLAATAGNPI